MRDLRNAPQVGRLQFLGEAARRDIYMAVLGILGKVGMLVDREEARAMLLEVGCTLTADERVLMPRHLVEQARLSAPSVVDVYTGPASQMERLSLRGPWGSRASLRPCRKMM